MSRIHLEIGKDRNTGRKIVVFYADDPKTEIGFVAEDAKKIGTQILEYAEQILKEERNQPKGGNT